MVVSGRFMVSPGGAPDQYGTRSHLVAAILVFQRDHELEAIKPVASQEQTKVPGRHVVAYLGTGYGASLEVKPLSPFRNGMSIDQSSRNHISWSQPC